MLFAKAIRTVSPIKKLECVAHVKKRMGTHLRNLKNKLGRQKLSDGKSLKCRLTDKIIEELQNYYRNAIMESSGDLGAMKQAVWATFYPHIH